MRPCNYQWDEFTCLIHPYFTVELKEDKMIYHMCLALNYSHDQVADYIIVDDETWSRVTNVVKNHIASPEDQAFILENLAGFFNYTPKSGE